MDTRAKLESRTRRKKRIRKKIAGSAELPRLCVYKSLHHMYAQLVDDEQGKVITGLSTLNKEVAAKAKKTGNAEAAKVLGEAIGRKAQEMGIKSIVFDRNGFKYHGRVKALAEGAREAGLTF
ncbi:MAG TPA: 50S ribosomal protein L18 [Syntrophorhabdales bacterium]|nr:50S ribosomal protein L18 [Syntrophorhabdales bacterium]